MDLRQLYSGKKIAILGMGREGWSTYAFLRELLPEQKLTLIDKNEHAFDNCATDNNAMIISGENYLSELSSYEVIFKAPGIPSYLLPATLNAENITSQTDLFLKLFSSQCIAVTGTKGKSTTSSLIYHILKSSGKKVHLAGNIGIPPLSLFDKIEPGDNIVMELSSHQLENISISPYIGIILNLFEEHLDHYHSYRDYCLAKINIGKFQKKGDVLIYGFDNEELRHLIVEELPHHSGLLAFSTESTANCAIHLSDYLEVINDCKDNNTKIADLSGLTLPGVHNRGNAMAASAACHFCGMSSENISAAIRTFQGLPHRIEFVGEFRGIKFYDDSISTIPAATIQAVETLKEVSTLILGGFDRGIDYQPLVDYLNHVSVENLIFTGPAGRRIHQELMISGHYKGNVQFAGDFIQLVKLCYKYTAQGKICLLSPAAASYDMFRNFEERGDVFKKNVREFLTFPNS